jgi:hypothetical protein
MSLVGGKRREVYSMGRVVSIHEYQLKSEAAGESFERAILEARERGLLRLPGLEESGFLRRIRGSRGAKYGTIWIYESVGAWEKLWGKIQSPLERDDYPENWRTWEDRVLAGYLDRKPDRIEFSAYEEF